MHSLEYSHITHFMINSDTDLGSIFSFKKILEIFATWSQYAFIRRYTVLVINNYC
jgi:hypothetical protein